MRRLGRALLALPLLAATAFAQAPPAEAPELPPGPLSLAQCIEIALARHPDIASAEAAVRSARAQAVISSSGLYPQLNLDASARVTQSLARPVNIGGGVIQVQGQRSTQRDVTASLDWTLFQTGQRDQAHQAKTQAAASVYSLKDVQRQLAYSVQSTYYQVLAAREQLKVAMSALANSQRHLDQVQARLDAGQVPASDLLPVRTEVARARLTSIQAETDMGTAEAALRALLVVPPTTPLELAEPLPVERIDADLPTLIEQAEQNRPDIAEQKLSLQAAQLSTKVAEAQAGVTLSAGGGADYGRHTGTSGYTWNVRVAASYPLFDAGAARASVTAARAREEQSLQRLLATRLQMNQDVETAFLAVRQNETAVAAARTAREEAELNLAAAEARYQEGLAIVIEVTDAQLALVQAQLAELRARYDYALALAALSRAVGMPPNVATGEDQ